MCNKISTAICHLQTKKLDFNIFNRFDPIQVRRGSYMFQVSVCMASGGGDIGCSITFGLGLLDIMQLKLVSTCMSK